MNTTTLTALAEPNRLHIIELIRDRGPLTIGDIANRLELNQPQTSKHVRVLHEAGLVEVQPAANRRIIKLRTEPFQELDHWLESFRSMWDDRLDRLDEYLRDIHGRESSE